MKKAVSFFNISAEDIEAKLFLLEREQIPYQIHEFKTIEKIETN